LAGGVIKQVVETQFTAKGANKVAKDTQKIGKEQTRLGQSSASAGRAFSAQANGLGGLVGAYAGAAANVFAITAAFNALNQAARSEQTIDGLNRLAATFGQVGSEVLSSLEDITKGQLSIAQVAQQANIALSAGLGPQLEGLTEVSLKASRALGRNLTDAFQRIVRGAGKLEPELLDELGIFARLDPAVEKYALQTGKSASSLTNFERRQAFANAVLEEGARKFATVNTTVPTTAEKLEKLSATIANIGQQLGAFLADFLAPVANFISNNLSAAVIAIGLLLRQLFGRALAGAASAFDGFITRISGRLSDLALRSQTTNQAFQQATSNIAKSANQINPGTLFGGKQAQEGAKILRSLREGGTISPADADAAAKALDKAAEAQTKFNKSAESTKRAEEQQKALKGIAEEVRNLEKTTNRYGKAATATFNAVNAAALRLKASVTSIFAFGSQFLLIIGIVEGVAAVVGQIFDTNLSPIAAIAGLISDANQESKKFAATLGEVTVEIAKTVNTAGLLPSEIAEAAANSAGDLKQVFDPSFLVEPLTFVDRKLEDLSVFKFQTSIKRSGQALSRLQGGIENLKEKVSEFGAEGRKAFVELQIAEEVEKVLIKFGESGDSAFRLLSRVANQTGLDAAQLFKIFQEGTVSINQVDRFTRNFEATIGGLTFSFADFEGKFFNFGGEAGATLIAVEANLRSFTEEFNRGSLNAEEAGKRIVALETQLGRVSEDINATLLQDISTITTADIERLNTQKLIVAELEKQLKPFDEIKNRLVTLAKLQKDLKSTLSSDIKEFEKAAVTGVTGPFGFAKDQITATKNQLAFQTALLSRSQEELKARKDVTDQLEEDLAPLENRLKLIDALIESNRVVYALAKERGASEKELADLMANTEQLQRNKGTLQTEIAKKQDEINNKNALLQQTEAIIRDITTARLGSILKLNDETTKLLRTQQKALKVAEAELKILNLRNKLNQKNREIVQNKADDRIFLDGLNNELKIGKANLDLADAQNKLAEKKRQLDALTIENSNKKIEAEKKLLSIESKRRELAIEGQFADKIDPIKNQISDLELLSNVDKTEFTGRIATEEKIRKLREKIINLEKQEQLAILEEKRKTAEEEFSKNREIINNQIVAAESALNAAKKDKDNLEERNKKELTLFDNRKNLEQTRAQFEIDRLRERKVLFAIEKEIADTQAQIQLDRKLEGIEQARRQLSVIEVQARTNNAFIVAQTEIVQKYIEAVNAQLREAGMEEQQISPMLDVSDFKAATADTIKRIGDIGDKLQLQQNRAEDVFSASLSENADVAAAKDKLNNTEIERLESNLAVNKDLAKIEKETLTKKQEAALADADIVVKNAGEKLKALKDEKSLLFEQNELTKERFKNERKEIIRNAKERLGSIDAERGRILDLVNTLSDAIEDEIKDSKKIVETLTSELDNLRDQRSIQQQQAEINLLREQQRISAETGKIKIDIAKSELEISKQINSNIQKRFELEQKLTEEIQKRQDIAAQIANQQSTRDFQNAQAGRQANIAAQQSTINTLDTFSNLRSDEQARQAREQLIKLETENQLAALKERERIAKFEAANATVALQRQSKLLQDENENNRRRITALRDIQDQETQIRQAEQAAELVKIANDNEILEKQRGIIETQRKIEDRKINAREKEFERENKLFEERLKELEVEQKNIEGFREGVNKFSEAVKGMLRAEGFSAAEANQIVGPSLGDISIDFEELKGLREKIEGLQDGIITEQRGIAGDKESQELAILDAQIKNNETLLDLTAKRQAIENKLESLKSAASIQELDDTITLNNSQISTINQQIKLEEEKLQTTLNAIDKEEEAVISATAEKLKSIERERAATLRLINDLVGTLNDGVGKALETIFDNIAEGKKVGEGLREVLFETFENARKTILKQTLIEPVQNFISESVGSFFGIGKKGADNASVVTTAAGDALLVSMASGGIDDPSSGVGKLLSGLDEAKQKSGEVATEQKGFFDSILEGFQTAGTGVKDFFGSIFSSLSGMFGGGSGSGGGGIFSMFSGMLGQGGLNFGQLFGGPSNAMLATGAATHSTALAMQQGIPFIPGSDFGSAGMFLASGGLVKRYAGGGNVISQDRVPALLQPGEFVMKRSAVNAMGANNMAMMNATGKSNGNVVVNIKNEGTPQDAQASQPKFDGEKMVIDIVTRDLRNNGPIRKSLRGGST